MFAFYQTAVVILTVFEEIDKIFRLGVVFAPDEIRFLNLQLNSNLSNYFTCDNFL